MQDRAICSVTEVVDDSTGAYEVGDLDYAIHFGRLQKYVETHGTEGLNNILSMLDTMRTEMVRLIANEGSGDG